MTSGVLPPNREGRNPIPFGSNRIPPVLPEDPLEAIRKLVGTIRTAVGSSRKPVGAIRKRVGAIRKPVGTK